MRNLFLACSPHICFHNSRKKLIQSTTHISSYQQFMMDLPNPNVLPAHRRHGTITPETCRYNHENCKQFADYWVDKNQPFKSPFNFTSYLQCLQNDCVRTCDKTKEFVVGYSKFEKITLTSNIHSSVIAKLSVEDFDTINNAQIQNFQNNLILTITGNTQYIDGFYSAKNPHLLLHILQSSTTSIIVYYLTLKSSTWWSNMQISKPDMVKLISDNFETIKAKHTAETTDTYYLHFIEIAKYERSVFAMFAPLIQTNVSAMNILISNFISSNTSTFTYIKEIMEECKIKINNEIVERGKNSWLLMTKTDLMLILDLLIKHGLVMTRKVVIDLIQINKFIPNPATFGIILDEEIVIPAIRQKHFAYIPPFAPTNKIMEELCANLPDENKAIEILDKYKSINGRFTQRCMENATSTNNKTVIKYLIEVAKINVDDTSYSSFSIRQECQVLFDGFEPTPINNEIIDGDTYVELNNEILTTVTKAPKSFCETDICILNKRMKDLLGIKTITISFGTLIPQIIQYLISNQYVIGQYFVIDGEFAKIMQMEGGEICHIDEVKNIAEYLVIPATPENIQQEVSKTTKTTKGRAKKAQ